LPDNHVALGFFDPQFRELLERQSYGNEGEQRQSARAALPAMSPDYIDAVVRELARVLKPSGYLMRWCDKYALCEAHHLRISAELLKIVDLIVTDNARMGMGYRTRARGEFLLVAQKSPIKARATWLRPSAYEANRPDQQIDRRRHPTR
jgi:site-specific DNA-methyltransferase (adenine-specific)